MKKLLLVANVAKEHIRKFHIPFITALRQAGWQVDVACRMDVPVPECDRAYDLPCDRDPFRGGLGKSIAMLKGIIAENGYDVVLCNTVVGSLVARLAAKKFRKKGTKVFYICHGLHFFEGAPLHRWLMGYPMEKLLAPCTDVMITINSADEAMAKKHLKPGAVERIHGIGVDLSRFRGISMTPERRKHLRAELGVGEDTPLLAYVAEINDNKNQKLLVDALALLRREDPRIRLMLIGPEHDGGALRESIPEGVLFLGWRDDIAELLHIADIYTASSKSEGLGVNLLEAMACGLPVVAARNRGHCEIIDDGVNGLLCDQGEPGELAERIRWVLEDKKLRTAIVEQAQQDIAKYETKQVLKELEEILERCL